MSVAFKAIIDVMENLAPLTLKEEWDNPGLLVGNPEQEVKSVLLTLDVTKENVCYAVEHHFDCIISHHPVIFSGIKALRTDTYDGRMFAQLLYGAEWKWSWQRSPPMPQGSKKTAGSESSCRNN